MSPGPLMPALSFRRPDTEDLEAVLAILNDPASVHRQVACRHGEEPEPSWQLYDRLLEDENLVAESGARVVGFASWQAYGRHVHLNALSVAGGQQRRGVGGALFEAFLREARDMGAASYSLRAYRDSEWALRFYARRGLHPVARISEVAEHDAGFLQYLSLAMANGQYPAAHKVLFYSALD